MKMLAPMLLLLAGFLFAGCFSHKQKAAASAPGASSMIITPDASLRARVVKYNDVGRFVVLSFPASQMPKTGQSLFLYRNGLKVAEVKVSNWQRDNLIVADLVNGDARSGDEARDR